MHKIIKFVILFFSIIVNGQGNTPIPKFLSAKDGIYLNYEDFFVQKPIHKSKIISTEFNLQEDFYFKVLNNRKLCYYNEQSVIECVKTEQIWAFSNDGNFYINLKGEFHKLSYLGLLSPLISSEETNYTSYDYPYSFYNESFFGMRDPYISLYIPPEKSTIETIQLLYEFESNSFYKFTYKNVEKLIQKDSLLSEQYHKLKRRQKRKLKYYFIRMYNDKNPINFIQP